ncbi:low molecular weight T-cell antigen [Mycobacteroides abscessus subsp. abscessus]|uniref:hemophore-related protein n=1 Tax=Mycobacteroides abscessus TaxID=36809 RepID=UPI0009265C0E|nr:hemophore-related protein [Mycobacteroides abscessus]SIE19235.1 low molecular weight T-cell antigen [Mycobacteroides abscessus subsp. abscessus]SIG04556.1 low molecular weight T-cell antigen [Mycobacteroides abscessus subsp. abscessus]SIG20874.1 low molecular weight T-cell antigen [Mycobacteroides abscessus subsp. abscessus]SIG56742.1 low molecular weight T-cell antigen [Mycobacteroides abscessus subsp. abscessus]
MNKLSLTKTIAAVGGITMALSAGAGLASADPVTDEMVNSTCTYEQANAALHAENPMAAEYFDASPPNQQFMREFLSSPKDKRLFMIEGVERSAAVGL